jgi:hypothetical protein
VRLKSIHERLLGASVLKLQCTLLHCLGFGVHDSTWSTNTEDAVLIKGNMKPFDQKESQPRGTLLPSHGSCQCNIAPLNFQAFKITNITNSKDFHVWKPEIMQHVWEKWQPKPCRYLNRLAAVGISAELCLVLPYCLFCDLHACTQPNAMSALSSELIPFLGFADLTLCFSDFTAL